MKLYLVDLLWFSSTLGKLLTTKKVKRRKTWRFKTTGWVLFFNSYILKMLPWCISKINIQGYFKIIQYTKLVTYVYWISFWWKYLTRSLPTQSHITWDPDITHWKMCLWVMLLGWYFLSLQIKDWHFYSIYYEPPIVLSTMFVLILQVRKPRHRKGKEIAKIAQIVIGSHQVTQTADSGAHNLTCFDLFLLEEKLWQWKLHTKINH